MLRDIKDITKIADENILFNLLKALSLQIGSMVEFKELGTLLNLNQQKIKYNLDILQKAFLIKLISPFFTNKRLEIVKTPKLYFLDTGIRNVIINNFNPLDSRVDKGALLENFIFLELKEYDLKYYRTKNGAEVDFILPNLTPIEVKSNLSDFKISKSMHRFLEKYEPKKGYLFNFNKFGTKEFNKSVIEFLPHFLAKRVTF